MTSATPSRKNRSAAILAAVLVCLFVLLLLGASILHTVTSFRRQVRVEAQRAQAERLAAAGIERGAAQRQSNGSYAGETWHVPAAELDGVNDAEVRVTVERGESGAVTIRASATFPAGSPTSRARAERRLGDRS